MPNKIILIVKCGSIGDVLRTTTILEGLNNRYPEHKIYWLTKQPSDEFLNAMPFIDKVILFSTNSLKQLIDLKIDLLVSLEDDFTLVSSIQKISRNTTIGSFINKQGNLDYTNELAEYFDMGLISHFGIERANELKKQNTKTYQDIISKALDIEKTNIELSLSDKNIEFAKNFSKKHNISNSLVIGLNTGAGNRWPLKKWSEEKTAQLADELITQFNAQVILFGGPEEIERNQRILSLCNNSVIDAGCNNSIMDFSALINLTTVFITSDSLALHIAVALKKFVITFFGPTSSAEIDLFDNGEKIMSKLECLCCYKTECEKKVTCMDEIAVSTVMQSVLNYVNRYKTISHS